MKDIVTIGREEIVDLVINEVKKQRGYTDDAEFSVKIEVFPNDMIMEITTKEDN